MSFHPDAVFAVTATRDDGDLLLSWQSTGAGPFQAYVGGELAWSGTATHCTVPWPADQETIEIGAVDPGEEDVDYSAELEDPPRDRALLRWQGGRYLSVTLVGFRVYSGPGPSQPVDYATAVAEVTAAPQGLVRDGYGRGGYGRGGYGRSASWYSWTSGRLSSGLWTFGVRPVDGAGNEGPLREVSLLLNSPPRAPAANSRGVRLRYTYDQPSGLVTLLWNLPPA